MNKAPGGYRGALYFIKTGNGATAEIQVTTPEMLLAKQGFIGNIPEDVAKPILQNIRNVVGDEKLPIGLGHKYFEVIRELDALENNYRKKGDIETADKILELRNFVEKESEKYYDFFSACEMIRLNSSSDMGSPKQIALDLWAENALGVSEELINRFLSMSKTISLPPELRSILTAQLSSVKQYDIFDLADIINIMHKSYKNQ